MGENGKLDNEEEIGKDHLEYLSKHPELTEVLNDFYSGVLLHKPVDVYHYATNYFCGFNNQFKKFKPLIIVGPSGVGKGTLIKKLLPDFQKEMSMIISHTTRPPRANEKHGDEYYFIDKPEFEQMVADKQMLEWTANYTYLYGSSKAEVERIEQAKKICLMDIDVAGAFNINKSNIDANFIFIYPPSLETLKDRLGCRGTEDEEVLRTRTEHSVHEIEQANSSILFQHKIINDDIDIAYEELKHLVATLYSEELCAIKAK